MLLRDFRQRFASNYAAHWGGLQSAAGSSTSARSLDHSPRCSWRLIRLLCSTQLDLHHPEVWEQWIFIFCVTCTTWWRPASGFLCHQSLSILLKLKAHLRRVHMQLQHIWHGTWQRLLRLQVLWMHSTSGLLDRARAAP